MAHSSMCSIEGCGKPIDKRGWCQAHYRRWQRHGDPLAGGAKRDGSRVKWLYDHADFRGKECLIWPFARLESGYPVVRMNGAEGSPQVASRAMCEIAHGPPPDPSYEAAHDCGNGKKGCVNPMHLKWKTPSENRADKLRHGTHYGGSRHHKAKLTEKDVRKIRRLYLRVPQSKLAARFGVSVQTISRIQCGTGWSWLK